LVARRAQPDQCPPDHHRHLITRLLPGPDDEDRIRLENAAAAVDEIRTVVRELGLSSASTAAEQCDEPAGCAIAVLVRRTEQEVYVGIRISGPVRENVTAVILAAVPAVADPAGWFLDVMPGRSASPGELVWSKLARSRAFGPAALWRLRRRLTRCASRQC
jgi:hypothetical protein